MDFNEDNRVCDQDLFMVMKAIMAPRGNGKDLMQLVNSDL